MPREYFELVSDQLAASLPPRLRTYSVRLSGRNLKVWYGTEHREHYEVQHLTLRGSALLEIGWHAEHPDAERNDEALARRMKREREWRRTLGADPAAGPFLGRAGPVWRRISEIWDAPDLWGEPTAIEAGARLAAYIVSLEA